MSRFFRSALFPLVLIVLLVWLASHTLLPNRDEHKKITYSELINRVESDPQLFNQYGSILVNPARFPTVKADLARRWHEWLTGDAGQKAVAGYEIDGQQVFYPNAKKGGS